VTGDLDQRLAFMEIGDEDVARLRRLGPAVEVHADDLVEAFYRHLLAFPRTRQLLRDPELAERLRRKQRDYLLSLTNPQLDPAYVERRRAIGTVHERIGLEPRWFLGAYALYLSLLTPIVFETCGQDAAAIEHTLISLQRLLLLDAQLALETYIERSEEELGRVNDELADATRHLRRDVADQRRALSQTTRRARQAEELASIGILVAGLAHEIGTPMGVIQGHAALLEKAVHDERSRGRLKTIREQIARISRIIQSLLNMARPHTGAHQPVELEPLLENTLSFLSEKLKRRDVRLERSFAAVPSVQGDPERLQQLLLNLCLNAIDAMPNGGELRIALARADPERVMLRIADDGIGIPTEDIDHIFDPFFTSKDAGRGNGLGLTVASGIVLDHGGTIEAKSTPGEGTEFVVVLPTGRTASPKPGSRAGDGAS